MQIKFEPNVSIGNIIEIVIFGAGVIGAYVGLIRRITKMEERVNLMYEWFKNTVLHLDKVKRVGE